MDTTRVKPRIRPRVMLPLYGKKTKNRPRRDSQFLNDPASRSSSSAQIFEDAGCNYHNIWIWPFYANTTRPISPCLRCSAQPPARLPDGWRQRCRHRQHRNGPQSQRCESPPLLLLCSSLVTWWPDSCSLQLPPGVSRGGTPVPCALLKYDAVPAVGTSAVRWIHGDAARLLSLGRSSSHARLIPALISKLRHW